MVGSSPSMVRGEDDDYEDEWGDDAGGDEDEEEDDWGDDEVVEAEVQVHPINLTFLIETPNLVSLGGVLFCLNDIQGDPSDQRLHFVDFDMVVPMSALFCLGSYKTG